jgi:hypothetical protein
MNVFCQFKKDLAKRFHLSKFDIQYSAVRCSGRAEQRTAEPGKSEPQNVEGWYRFALTY